MGELLLADLVQKTYNVSTPSLLWFSHLKHPGLVSCLNCFPLSGLRVMETMKWIPGRERRRRFLALVFMAAVCADLTVN